MFNTRVKTHITKSINDFNTGIYIPASLPSLDIVGGQAKPLGFGKRIIICAIDTGETHTLNFSKVQYLLNCSINTFGVRKLLGRDNIWIEDGNLVVNKEGLGIF